MDSPANNKKSFSRTVWAILPWIFLIGLIIILFNLGKTISEKKDKLALEKENAAQQSKPLVNIVVQEILTMPMEDSIDLPSITKAWQDLMLKSEVDGKIISLAVKEGDTVTKGQLIAQIDQSDYQNKFDSIQARYLLAQTNFKRLGKLKEKSAVSTSQYDESHAVLQELQAHLADAKLKLSRCSITAPIAGIINALPAKEGMLLAYGDPVAQIVDISKLKVDVAIPESDVSSIQNIEECQVVFTALQNKRVIGKKYFLAKQPSSAAMTYNLQLVLDNDDLALLPGMFARTKVVKSVHNKAIGIPLYAILSEDDHQFVYVIEENTAFKKPVNTGFMQGWSIQVTSGLKENDLVAIVGHRNLEEGQKVQIIKTVTSAEEITH